MNHTILDFRFGILDGGVSDPLRNPDVEMMPVSTQMMPTIAWRAGGGCGVRRWVVGSWGVIRLAGGRVNGRQSFEF
jgi:hypothetical protein